MDSTTVKVKDMMVTLPDYAVVSEDATLFEAVVVLEQAREGAAERDRHRAVLVRNAAGEIIGKLNLWDILQSLEPGYERLAHPRETPESGHGSGYIQSMRQTYGLWDQPLDTLCERAAGLRVVDIMNPISDSQCIDVEEALESAMHQLVIERCQSLLVREGDSTIGILRAGDVFREVCRSIRQCRS